MSASKCNILYNPSDAPTVRRHLLTALGKGDLAVFTEYISKYKPSQSIRFSATELDSLSDIDESTYQLVKLITDTVDTWVSNNPTTNRNELLNGLLNDLDIYITSTVPIPHTQSKTFDSVIESIFPRNEVNTISQKVKDMAASYLYQIAVINPASKTIYSITDNSRLTERVLQFKKSLLSVLTGYVGSTNPVIELSANVLHSFKKILTNEPLLIDRYLSKVKQSKFELEEITSRYIAIVNDAYNNGKLDDFFKDKSESYRNIVLNTFTLGGIIAPHVQELCDFDEELGKSVEQAMQEEVPIVSAVEAFLILDNFDILFDDILKGVAHSVPNPTSVTPLLQTSYTYNKDKSHLHKVWQNQDDESAISSCPVIVKALIESMSNTGNTKVDITSIACAVSNLINTAAQGKFVQTFDAYSPGEELTPILKTLPNNSFETLSKAFDIVGRHKDEIENLNVLSSSDLNVITWLNDYIFNTSNNISVASMENSKYILDTLTAFLMNSKRGRYLITSKSGKDTTVKELSQSYVDNKLEHAKIHKLYDINNKCTSYSEEEARETLGEFEFSIKPLSFKVGDVTISLEDGKEATVLLNNKPSSYNLVTDGDLKIGSGFNENSEDFIALNKLCKATLQLDLDSNEGRILLDSLVANNQIAPLLKACGAVLTSLHYRYNDRSKLSNDIFNQYDELTPLKKHIGIVEVIESTKLSQDIKTPSTLPLGGGSTLPTVINSRLGNVFQTLTSEYKESALAQNMFVKSPDFLLEVSQDVQINSGADKIDVADLPYSSLLVHALTKFWSRLEEGVLTSQPTTYSDKRTYVQVTTATTYNDMNLVLQDSDTIANLYCDTIGETYKRAYSNITNKLAKIVSHIKGREVGNNTSVLCEELQNLKKEQLFAAANQLGIDLVDGVDFEVYINNEGKKQITPPFQSYMNSEMATNRDELKAELKFELTKFIEDFSECAPIYVGIPVSEEGLIGLGKVFPQLGINDVSKWVTKDGYLQLKSSDGTINPIIEKFFYIDTLIAANARHVLTGDSLGHKVSVPKGNFNHILDKTTSRKEKAAIEGVAAVGATNVDATFKTLNKDNSGLSQTEISAANSIYGPNTKWKVLVASEHTDPVFHAEKIKEMVKAELAKPAGQRDFQMMYLITKHDGLPLKELASLPIPKYVHFSITSLGGTEWEPGVMKMDDLLDRIETFVNDKTLNPNLVTIRIDPIIPGVTYPANIEYIIQRATSMGIKNFKFSVIDSYGGTEGKAISRNIVEKMKSMNYPFDKYFICGPDGKISFHPRREIVSDIYHMMDAFADKYNIIFNTCGEQPNYITGLKHIKTNVGCVNVDMTNKAMGRTDITHVQGNQRKECSCFGNIIDALKYSDKCASSCVYCYAKHNSDSAAIYYNSDGTLKNNRFTQTSNTNTTNIKFRVETYNGFWTRKEVESDKDKVYLFGDNTDDRLNTHYVPSSTQAVIRGLPNAIGIDTKKNRGTSADSYFTDADFEEFKIQVDKAINAAKNSGKIIVIPANGIGTGAAQLQQKSPKCFNYLQNQLRLLKEGSINQQVLNSNISSIEVTYTPKGKAQQVYVVKGSKIYNKDGEEVFATDSVDRNKILANVAVKQKRAVVVDYRGNKYVVNNKNVIILGTTGQIMKWDEANGDRKNVLALASEAFTKMSESWARYAVNGYEVSSVGDGRFSALNAKFGINTTIDGIDVSGMTIEDVYQNIIKKSGKGKAPARDSKLYREGLSKEEAEDFSYYEGYLPLWQEWAKQNPTLIEELKQKSEGKTLTDKFASTRVSQARALADILHSKTLQGELSRNEISLASSDNTTPEGSIKIKRKVYQTETSNQATESKPKFNWNKEQQMAIDGVSANIVAKLSNDSSAPRFVTIQGAAGTGKTTIISAIIEKVNEELGRGLHIEVGALSHKAKSVLSRKLKSLEKSNEMNSHSIAGMLGMKERVIQRNGKYITQFVEEKPKAGEKKRIPIEEAELVLIDECSLVNEELLDLMIKKASPRAMFVFIGDAAQLPPVRNSLYYDDAQHQVDPSIDSPTFYLDAPKYVLKERVRQGEGNPILDVADKYRNFTENKAKVYPRNTTLGNNENVICVKEVDINPVCEVFEECISTGNPNYAKIIAYRNATVDSYNNMIHKSLFQLHSEESNDILKFFKNEPIIFNKNFSLGNDYIENNFEGFVTSVSENVIDEYGVEYYYATVKSVADTDLEYSIPIIYDTDRNRRKYEQQIAKFKELGRIYANENSGSTKGYAQYMQYKDKYADVSCNYAITAHKSQGSTYSISIVDVDDINALKDLITPKAASQAIYTGITRASDRVVLLDASSNNPSVGSDESLIVKSSRAELLNGSGDSNDTAADAEQKPDYTEIDDTYVPIKDGEVLKVSTGDSLLDSLSTNTVVVNRDDTSSNITISPKDASAFQVNLKVLNLNKKKFTPSDTDYSDLALTTGNHNIANVLQQTAWSAWLQHELDNRVIDGNLYIDSITIDRDGIVHFFSKDSEPSTIDDMLAGFISPSTADTILRHISPALANEALVRRGEAEVLEDNSKATNDTGSNGKSTLNSLDKVEKTKTVPVVRIIYSEHFTVNEFKTKGIGQYRVNGAVDGIRASDATVCFTEQYGSKKLATVNKAVADKHGTEPTYPQMLINPTAEQLREFLIDNNIQVLHIVGDSSSSEFDKKVKDTLTDAFYDNMEFEDSDKLNITANKPIDKKAEIKGALSNKFIGYGVEGSSTDAYRKQAGTKANVGTYNPSDTVFVSINGRRVNESTKNTQGMKAAEAERNTMIQKTIDEAINALNSGATILADNARYVDNSNYNIGEKELKKQLTSLGYVYEDFTTPDGTVIGKWTNPKFNTSDEILGSGQTTVDDDLEETQSTNYNTPFDITDTEDKKKVWRYIRSKAAISQMKRNVAITATYQSLNQGDGLGLPPQLEVAIVDDITAPAFGFGQEKSDKVDAYDGAAFVNPVQASLEDLILGEHAAGDCRKPIWWDLHDDSVSGVLFKFAAFKLNNETVRLSERSAIRAKNLIKKTLSAHTFSEELNLGDEDWFYEMIGGNDYPSYIGKYGKEIVLTSLEYDEDGTLISSAVVDGEDTTLYHYLDNNGEYISTTEKSSEYNPVNTLYGLWELFGGEYSINADGEYNDNSSMAVARLITSGNDFLKEKMIAYIASKSAIKIGAANINKSSVLSSEFNISNPDTRLITMKVRSRGMGIQLNAEHEILESEVSEPTQVISAANAYGYSPDECAEMQDALASYVRIQTDNRDSDSAVDGIQTTQDVRNVIKELVLSHNKDSIRRKMEGAANVLVPAYDMVTVFRDTDGSFTTLEAIRQKALDAYDAVDVEDKEAKTIDETVNWYLSTLNGTPEYHPQSYFIPGDVVCVEYNGTTELVNLSSIESYRAFKQKSYPDGTKFCYKYDIPMNLHSGLVRWKITGTDTYCNIFDIPALSKEEIQNTLHNIAKGKYVLDGEEVAVEDVETIPAEIVTASPYANVRGHQFNYNTNTLKIDDSKKFYTRPLGLPNQLVRLFSAENRCSISTETPADAPLTLLSPSLDSDYLVIHGTRLRVKENGKQVVKVYQYDNAPDTYHYEILNNNLNVLNDIATVEGAIAYHTSDVNVEAILANNLRFNPEVQRAMRESVKEGEEALRDFMNNRAKATYPVLSRFICARVPSQSLQSFMGMRCVGWLNSETNKAYVSHFQFYLQGSDLDIDKVYTMGFTEENGILNCHTPFATYNSVDDIISCFAYIPLPAERGSESGTISKELTLEALEALKSKSINAKTKYKTLGKVISLWNKGFSFENENIIGLDELKSLLLTHNNQKLNSTELDTLIKNKLAACLQQVTNNVENTLQNYNKVAMAKLRVEAEKYDNTTNMSVANPKTKYYMQRENMVGSDDIRIFAIAIKTWFGLSNYMNRTLKKGNVSLLNYVNAFNSVKGISAGKSEVSAARIVHDINVYDSDILATVRSHPEAMSIIADNYKYIDDLYSQYMSASTDNAKELILSRINCGVNMAKYHVLLAMHGFELSDIVAFCKTPIMETIDNLSQIDAYSEQEPSSIKEIIKELNGDLSYKKLNFKIKYVGTDSENNPTEVYKSASKILRDSIKNLVYADKIKSFITQIKKLNLSQDCYDLLNTEIKKSNMKTGMTNALHKIVNTAEVGNNLGQETVLRINAIIAELDKLDSMSWLKEALLSDKDISSLNFSNKKLNSYVKHLSDLQNGVRKNIKKYGLDVTAEIIDDIVTLDKLGDQLSELTTLFNLNQTKGIKSEEVINLMKKLKGATQDKLGMTDEQFIDFLRYDIDKYDSSKFNLYDPLEPHLCDTIDVLKESPYIREALLSLLEIDNSLSKNSRYKLLSGDYHVRLDYVEAAVNEYITDAFLKGTDSMLLNHPTKVFNNQFDMVDGQVILFKTLDGRASYKYWFEHNLSEISRMLGFESDYLMSNLMYKKFDNAVLRIPYDKESLWSTLKPLMDSTMYSSNYSISDLFFMYSLVADHADGKSDSFSNLCRDCSIGKSYVEFSKTMDISNAESEITRLAAEYAAPFTDSRFMNNQVSNFIKVKRGSNFTFMKRNGNAYARIHTNVSNENNLAAYNTFKTYKTINPDSIALANDTDNPVFMPLISDVLNVTSGLIIKKC